MRDRLAFHKAQLLRAGVPQDIAEARTSDFANGPLVGTPELVAERLTEMSKLGMSYAILNFFEVAYDRAALILFFDKVAPALR